MAPAAAASPIKRQGDPNKTWNNVTRNKDTARSEMASQVSAAWRNDVEYFPD